MAELLLELFSEEIPAGVQTKAAETLKNEIMTRLDLGDVSYKKTASYAGARRITLVIEGISKSSKEAVSERRGPRIDAPDKAVEGFLRSTGLAKNDLEKRKTDKGEFYFAVVKQKSRAVSEILSEAIQEVLCAFTWPKSMKWGRHNIRWTRPLHNILCVFDNKILPINFGHLDSNDKSFGHRFLAPKEFSVQNFDEYQTKLKKSFVILNKEERKKTIQKDSQSLASSCNLQIKNDPALLDEVAGLVEWPVALLGRIESKFMDVPQEVLITAMRSHQKYFSLIDKNGKLAPYFITIANITTKDKGTKIISGNERVLRARLEDAKFFWDQDRRVSLESRKPSLEKIVFHAKLGTVAEKTERITELAKLLSVWIPHANLISVERAGQLCKCDLVTEMVGEFPELQGLMGRYYALESKENEAVANAIYEHYSPAGPKDFCPKEPVSVAVALADKIDSLTGLFAANEKPTGSKDPYALRRAALGVIRIILENDLRIPLKLLFEKAIYKYPKALLKGENEGRKLLVVKKGESPKDKQKRIINELLEFFIDRLKASLKEKNVRHDLIQAVADDGLEDDLTRLVKRVLALKSFVKDKDGANLLAAYKRATNIVLAEEKKDGVKYSGNPSKELLQEKAEKELYMAFEKVGSKVEKLLKNEEFEKAMAELSGLRKPVDNFFDGVKVNDKNPDLRKNRLLLLAQLRAFLDKVANFGKIEG